MGGEEVCLPQDSDTLSSCLFSAQPLLSPSVVRLQIAINWKEVCVSNLHEII